MAKYKISRHVGTAAIEGYFNEEIPEKYRGLFVLNHDAKKIEYVINETIKFYLDKFSEPKAPEDVTREVETEVKSKSPEVEATCKRFFAYLLKRRILVRENEQEILADDIASYQKGELIDDLCIEEIISENDYIEIYSATRINDETKYIVKLLHRKKVPSRSEFDKELIELEKEFELLEKVRDIPYISRVYQFNKRENEYAYFTLEYIEGKSLSKFLSSEEALTEEDTIKLIYGILQAFSLLHQHEVIHGDIHSSNLLISANKEIKVIDLGLSPNVKNENNQVLKFGGVDFYMPPERINISSTKKFSREPDYYSDVYQIGLLMYLVLYNTLPFTGFTWEELAVNIKETAPECPAFTFLGQPVPYYVTDMVKRCLSKNPAARYANAAEILADFQKYVLHKKELV
ncbi:MAG TPA: protein kinase [Chitinophagaceae bacterium]|nr:protein kinase [Chitinophagaceae bacterium]